jgi:phenylalanyl-tRNA synthetase beta chain
VSVVVDRRLEAEACFRAIRASAPSELEEVQLYDVYTGASISPEKKSLTFALVFRSTSRTLEDDEVFAMRDGIVRALASLGAALRS